MDENDTQEAHRRPKRLDKCNTCSARIKWQRDADTGKYYASVPGSMLRHFCRTIYPPPNNKDRDGYI